MLQDVWTSIQGALGIDVEPKELTFTQLALRALIIYIVGVALVRMGKKRFLGKGTAFDVLLAIMIGAVLGRAINGSGPFFETIGAVVVLVGLHWLFAVGAFHSARFRQLVEGTPRPLIQDGEVQTAVMHKSRISDDEVLSTS